MQDVADQCDRSTSLLHHHFDTKEDLLVELLAHLLATVRGARIRWVTLGNDAAPRTIRTALVDDVADGRLTA